MSGSVKKTSCARFGKEWSTIVADCITAERLLEDLHATFDLKRTGAQTITLTPRVRDLFYDDIDHIKIDIETDGHTGVRIAVEHTLPLPESLKHLAMKCLISHLRSMCEAHDSRFTKGGTQCTPTKTLRMVMLALSRLCVGTLSGTNPLSRLESGSH